MARESGGPLPGWVRPDWPVDVLALTTTRAGGVSKGACASLNLAAHVGDEAACVRENRRRLRSALSLSREPAWLRQVHGTAVVDAARADGAEADASFTSEPGVVCAVLTADCLPVLFAARDGSVVAAAHAGWRGLAAGVLDATLDALPVANEQLIAWLGPAISPPAFEVGGEVRERFLDARPESAAAFVANSRGRWQADLSALARLALKAAGVGAVYGGGFCTHGDPARFFSHRREPGCGRMASVIAIDRP